MAPVSRSSPLHLEARARISWGSNPEVVSAWLRDEGVPAWEIRRLIPVLVLEHQTYYVKQGLKGLIIGGILLVLGLAVMNYQLQKGFPVSFGRSNPDVNRMAIAILTMLYGCGRVVLGFRSWLVDSKTYTPRVAPDDGLSF